MRRCAMLLLAIGLFPASLEAREWTDSTGQFRRQAEFLYQRDGQVWLRAPDGKLLVVSPAKLSTADQRFLASLLQPNFEPPSTPSVTAAPTMPVQTARTANVPARLLSSINSAAVARLTGWHCYSGHCHVTQYHHHPAPLPPPAPSTSKKRIYHGCYGTFHLPLREVGKRSGTGAYKFLVGSYVVEYLEMLIYNGPIPGFSVYAVDTPGPLGITNWYFEDVAPAPGSYRVYYFAPSTGVVLYEYAHRRNPQ